MSVEGRRARSACSATLILLLLIPIGAANSLEPPKYFVFRAGAAYDAGDFGTSRNFHILFLPLTLRSVWDRFDLELTSSWVYVESEQRIALAEGVPNPANPSTAPRTTESGVGDTILKSRLFLVKDPGAPSLLPAISPYVKIKIPTADADKNLGTGKPDFGLGMAIDKSFEPLFLFADVGYTFIGKPSGEPLNDRPSASGGLGFNLDKRTSLSVQLDWRRALVQGFRDPLDLLAALGFRFTPTISMDAYGLKGLSSGSPNYGGGFDVAYKFGIR